MKQLAKLFKARYGSEPESVVPLSGSGSARRYFRLRGADGASAIGVLGTDRRENDTFIYMSRQMRAAGLRAPEVYAVSRDGMAYLQQDLGDVSLFSKLHTPEGDAAMREVMRTLHQFQSKVDFKEEKLYPVSHFGMDEVKWDLNYFKYCFLKATGVVIDEAALDKDFDELIMNILIAFPPGLVYRDLQSRNIMLFEGKPWWIDFQSARRGPAFYDVASLLWQASARFTPEERMDYFAEYLATTSYPWIMKGMGVDIEKQLYLMVLFRTLQVLGAYGLRGLTERKAHFLQSIPAALGTVRELLENGTLEPYPELTRLLREIVAMPRFQPKDEEGLTVTVFSFSYKKGYPEDLSGNGGGFMFDCRAMHNPGRYEQFKALTGRDEAVRRFLEQKGEVQPFVESAWSLVRPSVARYLERGFTSLQVGFGCTGGRHRSVYCAERMAERIREAFPAAKVKIEHRENPF